VTATLPPDSSSCLKDMQQRKDAVLAGRAIGCTTSSSNLTLNSPMKNITFAHCLPAHSSGFLALGGTRFALGRWATESFIASTIYSLGPRARSIVAAEGLMGGSVCSRRSLRKHESTHETESAAQTRPTKPGSSARKG
jgi:hypothetical protein